MVNKKSVEAEGWNNVHFDANKLGGGQKEGRKVNAAALAEGVSEVLAKVMVEQEQEIDQEMQQLDKVLDNEDMIEKIRRKRIAQLKATQMKQEKYTSLGHGKLSTIQDQKEFFTVAQKSDQVICHFFTTTNRRCDIVDARLTELAGAHMNLKCVRIDAEKSPFIAERLNIFMIPSIVLIKNGKSVHTVSGFDELGGTDSWSLDALRTILADHELLDVKKKRSWQTDQEGASVMMKSRRWSLEEDDFED
eukprot:GHVH01005263.1.p2 GENE.GHVH01005263.1~~GHVH01005263.1.p2  ORF type:complete len:248 (+),score=45.87 GHVH01005263.1:1412-2155(+)